MLQAENIDFARSELAQQGVEFDGATQTVEGVASFASFLDLSDNRHSLVQELQVHPYRNESAAVPPRSAANLFFEGIRLEV